MILSKVPNKSFKQDLVVFYNKLLSKENFSFSKYADGEWAVIQNCPVNNGEFWFDPNNSEDQKKRRYLIESFEYKNPQYYVGISCPCCQGNEIFEMMKVFLDRGEGKPLIPKVDAVFNFEIKSTK